jgi:hypothetical protein
MLIKLIIELLALFCAIMFIYLIIGIGIVIYQGIEWLVTFIGNFFKKL